MALFGRKKTQNVQDGPWGFHQFADYFRHEAGKFGNSREFRAITKAMKELEEARNESAGKESAMKMVAANDKLIKACEKYLKDRAGARTDSGIDRLDKVGRMLEFQKAQNIDQIRDMRVVRQFAGKTWNQVGALKVPEIRIEGKGETVGANVSERMKVEYNGKKGFFTERREIKSMDVIADEMIASIDGTAEPEKKQIMEGCRDYVVRALNTVKLEEDPKTVRNEIIMNNLADCWNSQFPDEKTKENFGDLVIMDSLETASSIMSKYFTSAEALPEGASLEERKELLESAIQSSRAKDELKDILSRNKDFLLKVPEPDENMKSSAVNHMRIKRSLIIDKAKMNLTVEEGRLGYDQLTRLIKDDKTVNSMIKVGIRGLGDNAAYEVSSLKKDAGNELTSRNVATSRIAELLGLGHLVAHSTNMIVHDGDRTVTGSFMEFAEGTDLSSRDYMDQKRLSEVEDIRSPEFNRDACSIEVLDFICGQGDRHAKNIFYKLSDLDENGKRRIIGLQGIDNDLAFNDWGDLASSKTADLFKMTFISQDVAEKVKGLDRAAIEYAVGDLLPESQIDALMERITKMQKQVQTKMVELRPDEWKLDEFDPDKYPKNLDESGLDERGKNYVRGLRDMNENYNKGLGMGYNFKSALVKNKMDSELKPFLENEKEQDEIFAGARGMFDEAEKEAVKEVGGRRKVGFGDLERAQRRQSMTIPKKTEAQAEKTAKSAEKGMRR